MMGHGQGMAWFILLLFCIQVTVVDGRCKAALNDFVPYKENSDVTFTCTINQCGDKTPFPTPVEWSKSNSLVTDGVTTSELPNNTTQSTLVMTLQRSDNNKVIRCSSSFADSVSKTLNVTYKPVISITPSSGPLIVTEGESARLTCQVEESNPPVTSFEWTFGSSVVSTNAMLTLKVTRRDSSGVYQCSAENTVGVTLAQKEIEVEYGPDTVSLSPDTLAYDLTEGIEEMPPISCSADCNPTCVYTWGRRATSSVLDLNIAERRDAGIHTCQANNRHGTASASINVTVRYPPDIIYAGTRDKEEGDDFWISCIARGVPNNYTYLEWYQIFEMGGPRVRTGNLTSTGRVLLSDLSYMDNGLYFCSVSNGVATPDGQTRRTERMAKMRVNGPPHGLQSLYVKTGVLGKSVIFLVNFFQFARGDITVSWYNVTSGEVVTPSRGEITLETVSYDTQFFSTNVTVNGRRIVGTIHNITAWDFGSYVVHLRSVGQKRLIHLRVDREAVTADATVNGWLVSTVILLVLLAGCVLVGVLIYRRGVLPKCGEKKENNTSSGLGDTDGHTYSDSPTIDAVTYDPSLYTPLQVRQQVEPENPYGNVQSGSEHTYEFLKAKGNVSHGSPEAASADQPEASPATDTNLYQNVTVGSKQKILKPPKSFPKPKLQLPKKTIDKTNTKVHSNGAVNETESL